MQTGWSLYNKQWYHLGTDEHNNGQMDTGWIKSKGKWYYLSKNEKTYGQMLTGWIKDKDKWYYASKEKENLGEMLTGWIKSYDNWYYLDKSGAMQTSSWLSSKGKEYYLKANGAMATSSYVKDKKNNLYYWVDKDGVYQSKWDTATPNLKKYNLAYASGTSHANRGFGTFDEAGPGTEFYIEGNGYFKEYQGGEMVFNQTMKNTLFDFAKNPPQFVMDSLVNKRSATIHQVKSPIVQQHFDTLLNVQGNLDRDILPDVKRMVNQVKNELAHSIPQQLYRDLKYR